MTGLDQAQAAVLATDGPGADAARLTFFHRFADTPLFVLLEREAEGASFEPRIFDLTEGRAVLAFDLEERLARMGQGPMPYAELPGRVLARLLAGEGLALGLNFGAACASEMLLPAEAMQWLDTVLAPQSDVMQSDVGLGDLTRLDPPHPGLLLALSQILQNAPDTWAGMAQGLAVYSRDGAGVILVQGAAPGVDTALQSSLFEALRFCDLSGQVIDIGFVGAKGLPDGGARMIWPAPLPASAPVNTKPPGMDKDQPPKLR
jgi:hypothetical protein